MIRCQTCGEANPDGSKFCMNCGSSMNVSSYSRSSQPVDQQRRPPYEPTYQPQRYYPRYQEPLSAWAYICSCCVPLAGFAIWLSIRDNRPDEANTILILAILSLVVSFFSGINS